ncbi:MAG: VWA domain-containing protein [Planctomycetota bacterium]
MGVEPVAPGEDTQWNLRFHLGWPDWFLFVFVIFAFGFVTWIYLREGNVASRVYRLCLAGLRLACIFAVVVMIGGLELSMDRTGLPYLVLMVDDSESMQVRDRQSDQGTPEAQEPTRLERVKQWLGAEDGKRLRELTGQHKLQLHAQSTAPRLLGTYIDQKEVAELLSQLQTLEAVGTESRLGANLRTVLNNLRGTPPSSVVFITDGVTTQGEPLAQAAQYAARKNIPIFTVGVGDPGEIRDLEIHDLLVDNVVFVDDIVTFEAKLSAKGFENQEITVSLRQKGVETPLDQKTYRIQAGENETKIRLAHRPTVPGTIEYVVDVPVENREIVTENNKIERSVEVLKEKIRVLYVESFPRYEFRFLKHLLERESTVELKVVLLDSDPEYVQQDRSAIEFFPTSKQDLFTYDVILLGDVAPTLLTPAQLENIRDFVRVKGGGLLVLAGPNFVPATYRDTLLDDLLPVVIGPATNRELSAPTSTGFSPRLTVEGRASPIFRFAADEMENDEIWRKLPPLYWFARVDKAKPGAQVLAEHPTELKEGIASPLVATQFFGAGRTYFQAFDSTWRWRYRVEELYHSRYWVQTVRYLSRSKLLGKNRSVELLVDRRQYRRGEPVQVRVRFLDESLAPRGDDAVSVTLEHEVHGNRTLQLKASPDRPTVFEGVFSQAQDGRYRLRLSGPAIESPPSPVEFSVKPPPGELDRVQMNEAELRQVAEATGGHYYRLADANNLFSALPPGRRVALHTDPPFPLWNTPPALFLFVLLLCAEWILRKRKSMV